MASKSTSFIVNPLSISFENIRDDLMNYVAAKPDYDSWKDFYASGTGQTIIELAAALGAMYSYQFILGRREAYLQEAQNYSSLLGNAGTVGYSASRGNNVMGIATVIPTATMSISKWDIVGQYQEYDIVALEDAVFNNGVQSTLPVIIGDFMEQAIDVNTDKLTQFKFTASDTTDTVRLTLNDMQVPLSSQSKDALNDYYVGISNAYGSVDVFYLQQGDYKYTTGDILKLQYIARNNVEGVGLNLDNMVIFNTAKVNSFNVTQDRQDTELPESIRVKAPIYHETGGVIRSRHDYSKYILLQYPILADANDRDIYPGLIEITGIKQDGTFLTDIEEQEMLDAIEEARPSGVARAQMSKPIEVNKLIHIDVTKMSGTYLDAGLVDAIDTVLNELKYKLAKSLDLHALEHAIDAIEGVKISRVTFDQPIWQPETYYELYDITEPSDYSWEFSYYARSFKYESGSTEPTWPTKFGETVTDGRLVWKKSNDNVVAVGLMEWEPNKSYEKYEYVRGVGQTNSLYQCVGQLNYSGDDAPDWSAPDVRGLILDGELIWKKVETVTVVPELWEPNKNFNIGEYMTPAPAGGEIYLCVGYRAKSGATEPTWVVTDVDYTVDERINWYRATKEVSLLEYDWNQYVNVTKELIIR